MTHRLFTLAFVLVFTISLPMTVSAGKLGKKLAVAGVAVGGKLQHDKKKDAKKAAEEAAAAVPVVTCPKLPPDTEGMYGTRVLITDVHTDGGASEPTGEELIYCGYSHYDDAKTYTGVVLDGPAAGTEIHFRSNSQKSQNLIGMCRQLTYQGRDREDNDNSIEINGGGRNIYSNALVGGVTGCDEYMGVWTAPSGRVPDEAFQNEAREIMELGSREYMFMETLWPAFEVYKERARNSAQKPSFKGDHFDRVCKNTFNKADNALAKKWKKSFGYERCGDNDENFYKVLSWFDRETKDYSATADWLDFSYQSADQLTNPIFSDAHKNIWLLAYRFNMYVGAELADEKVRSVVVPFYRALFKSAIADVQSYATSLFDVNSLDDVKERTKRLDLYPEEIAFYTSLLDEPDEYEAIIDAFIDNANTGLTPDESKFETLYENFALVEACYRAREGMLVSYISYDQYKAAQQKYKSELSKLSVASSKKKEIISEVDQQVATTQQAMTVAGWDDYINSTCEGMLMVHMGYY